MLEPTKPLRFLRILRMLEVKECCISLQFCATVTRHTSREEHISGGLCLEFVFRAGLAAKQSCHGYFQVTVMTAEIFRKCDSYRVRLDHKFEKRPPHTICSKTAALCKRKTYFQTPPPRFSNTHPRFSPVLP